jgi:hypothetical protein
MKYMYIKKDTKSCKQTGGPGFEVNFLKPHLMHFICLNLAFIERIWLFFFHWQERGSPKDHFTSLGMVPFRSVSDVPACQPRRLLCLRVENSAKNHKSPLTLLGPYLGGIGGSPGYQNFIRTIPTAHRDGHHH